MKVTFKFPMKVNKVFFTNMSANGEHYSFSDITDLSSLNKVASQWIGNAASSITGAGSTATP